MSLEEMAASGSATKLISMKGKSGCQQTVSQILALEPLLLPIGRSPCIPLEVPVQGDLCCSKPEPYSVGDTGFVSLLQALPCGCRCAHSVRLRYISHRLCCDNHPFACCGFAPSARSALHIIRLRAAYQ
jgi:hypothetical protein